MLLSYMYLRYVSKGAEKVGIRLVIGGGGMRGWRGLKKIQHKRRPALPRIVPFDSRRFIGDVITPSSGSKVPNDRKERHPKRETMLSIRLIHNIDKF